MIPSNSASIPSPDFYLLSRDDYFKKREPLYQRYLPNPKDIVTTKRPNEVYDIQASNRLRENYTNIEPILQFPTRRNNTYLNRYIDLNYELPQRMFIPSRTPNRFLLYDYLDDYRKKPIYVEEITPGISPILNEMSERRLNSSLDRLRQKRLLGYPFEFKARELLNSRRHKALIRNIFNDSLLTSADANATLESLYTTSPNYRLRKYKYEKSFPYKKINNLTSHPTHKINYDSNSDIYQLVNTSILPDRISKSRNKKFKEVNKVEAEQKSSESLSSQITKTSMSTVHAKRLEKTADSRSKIDGIPSILSTKSKSSKRKPSDKQSKKVSKTSSKRTKPTDDTEEIDDTKCAPLSTMNDENFQIFNSPDNPFRMNEEENIFLSCSLRGLCRNTCLQHQCIGTLQPRCVHPIHFHMQPSNLEGFPRIHCCNCPLGMNNTNSNNGSLAILFGQNVPKEIPQPTKKWGCLWLS